MANVRGSSGIREKRNSPGHVVEEFVPSSGWTEDSNGHYLLVDLPGFKKEEVKLRVYNSSKMVVSGKRQINESKHVYFEQAFNMPKNSDVEKITGKFDGEILYVTVPKQIVEQKTGPETTENIENKHDRDDDQRHNVEKTDPKRMRNKITGFCEEKIKKWDEKESSILGSAMEMLRKNKGIVITAVLAFSLGIIVSHKFESTGLEAP